VAEWRGFNASNEPDTCIWCGKKLRFKVLHSHNETTQVPLDPNNESDQYLIEEGQTTKKKYTTVVDERATVGGDYQDGFFCGLRCGYQFGVRMGELGRRLQEKTSAKE
jgi:hypothetical protein